VSTQEVLKGPRQPLKSTSRDSNDCLYDIEERKEYLKSSREFLDGTDFAWRGFGLAPLRGLQRAFFAEL